MYCFSDSEAGELITISSNLSKILSQVAHAIDEGTLNYIERTCNLHEWCEKARKHKAFPIAEIQEMYNQIDDKYKEVVGKSRIEYSNEKTN